jgi:hypothetical protein
MLAIIAIVIAGAIVFGAGTGIFLMIVISIHKVDQSKGLTSDPRTPVDAFTRRILGAGGYATSRCHDEES